ILRTPWPHVLVPAGAAEPDGDGPARRRRQHHREHERGRARYAAEPAPEDLELEAEDLPSREVGAAAAPPPREPADLAFANAEGPETHVYHAMAVHLYMRRK